MPKAKKSSKKDTSDFIKKVASAGRGGDTELAYLSPKARDLLKKLGGAGTKNPDTGLKEFKAASRFAKAAAEERAQKRTAEDSLAEFNALRQAALDRMAEQTLAPAQRPAEVDTIQPTLEEEIIAPPPAPPVQAPVIPENLLAAIRAAQQRPAQQPEVVEDVMPTAPAPGTAAADLAQFDERDMIPRDGEEEVLAPAPAPTAAPVFQPPYTTQFDPSRLRAPDTAASNLAQLMEVGKPDQEPMASTPAAITQQQQDAMIGTVLTPEQLAAITQANAAAYGRLTTGIGPTFPEDVSNFLAPLQGKDFSGVDFMDPNWYEKWNAGEEAKRRAAEEQEARRRAEEEEARRRAAEAEAAKRAAEEEARRRAEEQARYIAEQEAAARRAAEEARRVAEEAERRRLAEEEARRRALEEEERRRNQPPPPPPPPPPPLQTTLPPGLISSPLPTAPPPAAQPPAAPPPETGAAPAAQPPPPRPQGINLFSQSGGGFFSGVDPNSDIGRLIARLRERGAGRGFLGATGSASNAPVTPISQMAGGIPTSSAPMPVSPMQGAVAPTAGMSGGSGIPAPVSIPYPTPQLPGAGTPTPFFNPSAGGLTPGTVPVSQMPQSLQTSDLPLQALAANPNLAPTILGGAENLGYYVDRFGNIILAPGAVRPPGRKKGGPASDAELLQALQDATGSEDMASAKAMLEQLSNEPGESRTELKLSPTAQSIRRVSRRPIRAQTDRGTAKGMAMELEEVTKTQGPRTKGQVEDMRQKMELLRNTLGMPTFSKATLAREGELMTRRFKDGGEARSSLDTLLGAAKEKLFGKDEEPEPAVQGPLPKPGPGTRRYFEEKGKQLRGSPPVGIEREAQIRSKMGPEYVDLVRENIGETAMVGDPERQWNLQGVNFTPSTSREQLVQYMRQRLEPVLSTSKDKTLPEDKRIFAIGRAATPQIYAHELRHEKVFDEGYNRVLDLVNAGSRPAYEDRIDALYSYHMSRDPVYTKSSFIDQMYLRRQIPFADKERYVLNKVEPMLGRYLNKEAPLLAGEDFGKDALRKNYNLNALGAVGPYRESGEQLEKKVIKQRARYPFLNFVGRENMPLDQDKFPLPDYLDPEMRKKK